MLRLRETAATPRTRGHRPIRAFALFALSQAAEAELVIEASPASIRRGRCRPARRRLAWRRCSPRPASALPGVLRQRIAAARAMYAEKRYDASAEAFTGPGAAGAGDGQGRRRISRR
jgi:hypothetical protein